MNLKDKSDESSVPFRPWPKWILDLDRLLPIRSQFVLHGNIRDRFLTPLDDGTTLTSLLPCLWAYLQTRDYSLIMVFDRVDGIRIYPDTPTTRERASKWFDLKLDSATGNMIVSLDTLLAKIRQAVSLREASVAVVVDYASRLLRSPQELDDEEKRLFVGCEKSALTAMALRPRNELGKSFHNPVIWLANRSQDLPSWFVLDSERIHSVSIEHPDYEQRLACARLLSERFAGVKEATEIEREESIRVFTDATDGLTLQAMSDISQLAVHQAIPLREIDDAVRCFKVGSTDNPWRKDYLRGKIAGASDELEARVKGQRQAIVKTVDILTRSVMGLTGAHTRSRSSRPRGVLFFAGSTGVGKTELAKALTQLMFGDERAYIRFDMSEFSEEHASARLLGAPPGYVGYDAGGELTNAVRRRPFSVILFDEIEKAHPRLMDKFLQILEDGRLTDGRGETTYFSECVIIFTSNLGIYGKDDGGQRVTNVSSTEPYEKMEQKVKGAIGDYFKFDLGRPELLNRIGDNIVVFAFIDPMVAQAIFSGMLANVEKRTSDEHKVELVVTPKARDKLLKWCTEDLSNGGRGIGNRLETTFVNPLARALFQIDLRNRKSVSVADVLEEDNVFRVNLA